MVPRDVVIVGAARTPIGSLCGSLSSVPAPELGAAAIKAAVQRTGVQFEVDEVIMGCVVQAGIGQNPARQSALKAGLPPSVKAMTVNKVCSSGLMAVMLAAQAIRYGEAEVIVAGGMENMSLAPHFLRGYRTGQRLGDGKLIDCIVHDGLWCPFGDVHMGEIAEATAKAMGIARPEQDAFAAESYKRAQAAIDLGYFRDEIVPVTIPQKKGEPVVVVTDEEPGKGKIEKFPTLPPAFVKDGTGTITAANASSINDGAAAVVIMSAEKAEELGLFRSPKIVEWASFSMKPEEFPVAPNEAVRALLNKTVLNLDDVDAWEINEAFSVVSLANNRLLGLDGEKVNIRGGAVALGHPIGASGARILVTLLYIMKANDYQKGVAALCNGGGEATAMLIGR